MGSKEFSWSSQAFKPELIMLLVLPIILSRISHNSPHYSLFLPMPSPIRPKLIIYASIIFSIIGSGNH